MLYFLLEFSAPLCITYSIRFWYLFARHKLFAGQHPEYSEE
jgi:hypothetical protein